MLTSIKAAIELVISARICSNYTQGCATEVALTIGHDEDMGIVGASTIIDCSPSRQCLVTLCKGDWCSLSSKTWIKRVYTKPPVSHKRMVAVRFSPMRVDSNRSGKRLVLDSLVTHPM